MLLRTTTVIHRAYTLAQFLKDNRLNPYRLLTPPFFQSDAKHITKSRTKRIVMKQARHIPSRRNGSPKIFSLSLGVNKLCTF